ncbi:hypothetical protein MKX01_032976 [Papaver californicum]|nr:hypothetical protein MKX01_032976 [Papaver californicum]
MELNEGLRLLILTAFVGVLFCFLVGISFSASLSKFTSSLVKDSYSSIPTEHHAWSMTEMNVSTSTSTLAPTSNNHTSKMWVSSNPRGAERLPPGIVVAESDLYARRLWGEPSEDLTMRPKYLVTFAVGFGQKSNIDAAIKKFPENFTILLFHYDGRTSEWDDLDWSRRAIHISVLKQTKWWYAKRFLHPYVVAPYDYIFIWDEDLGVENFDAEEYLRLVRKHGLEISQPGLDPDRGTTWQMTKRRRDVEVHKDTTERPAFVEIMAPVFSRDAWRCPAQEKIGVVDAQWIDHQTVPSIGNQGIAENGKAPWEGVRDRCTKEWSIFRCRHGVLQRNGD